MWGLNRELEKLPAPIRIGLVGAGYMGSGIFNIINQVKGIDVIAIYDTDKDLAKKVVAQYNRDSVKVIDSIQDLCAIPEIDVIVDGTPDPEIGAETGYFTVKNKKDLVSINIETDVTAGRQLKKLFEDSGCIYSVTAGDEPGELKRFYDHYALLNFRIVAAGKGKNNPLNVEATPDTVRPGLPKNGITAEQVTSFVDGTKTMYEMACLSNATGLVPDKRGMHGPKAKNSELTEIFRHKDKGGILNEEGVVDYITGDELSGGVFIVVSTENERLISDFSYLKIGKGPYYLFYQRYHNWFIDIPLTIAQVRINRKPVIIPLDNPVSEVMAVAKRDINKGEVIDGIGGCMTYGIIEKSEIARQEYALPLGLARGGIAEKNISKGSIIRRKDVDLNSETFLYKLIKY